MVYAKRIWFKRKCFGWGWRPVTWEGWTVIILYLLVALPEATLFYIDGDINFNAIVKFSFNTFLLILICFLKGERPKWSWGKEKKDENKN